MHRGQDSFFSHHDQEQAGGEDEDLIIDDHDDESDNDAADGDDDNNSVTSSDDDGSSDGFELGSDYDQLFFHIIEDEEMLPLLQCNDPIVSNLDLYKANWVEYQESLFKWAGLAIGDSQVLKHLNI